MIRFAPHDKALMDFLGVEITEGDLFNPKPTIIKHRDNRDKGQREPHLFIKSDEKHSFQNN